MKNILFDLYGTLIDIHTDEEQEEFWNELARRTKKYKEYDATSLRNKYLEICEELSKEKEEIEILDVFEKLFNVNMDEAKRIARIFRKLSTEYIRLYPYVKKLLKELRDKGNKLFVLSNAQSAFTIPELKKLGVLNLFDGIAISSDYSIKKPNTNFFKKAINNFNLKGEIWMIGNDYECDIKPAQGLGLKTLFIKSNLTPPCKYPATIDGFSWKKIMKILNE
ncbi:MAG: HAD family hydrolase [Erysipelotrichales bacterium]|nr:HAD family hydrolase [Erysipelotrichales bacterium]